MKYTHNEYICIYTYTHDAITVALNHRYFRLCKRDWKWARVPNHAVHSYASRLCWSDQRLHEGRLLDLGRRVGVAKSFLWEEWSPVSTVAQTFVRFACLLLLSTRKVASRVLTSTKALPKESTWLCKGFVGIQRFYTVIFGLTCVGCALRPTYTRQHCCQQLLPAAMLLGIEQWSNRSNMLLATRNMAKSLSYMRQHCC